MPHTVRIGTWSILMYMFTDSNTIIPFFVAAWRIGSTKQLHPGGEVDMTCDFERLFFMRWITYSYVHN